MRIRKNSFLAILIMTLLMLILVPTTNSYAASKKKATLSKKAKAAYIKKVKKIKKSTKKYYSKHGYSSASDDFYKITYRFMDVDGDKKKEMLVTAYDPNYPRGRGDHYSLIQSSVYKYRKGKVTCVLKCPYLKGELWQPSLYRYYPKTHTLVFESFSNLGIPRYELYYKWNGKKFVLKVKKKAYYTPATEWWTDDISYDVGSEALQKKLMKGKAKNMRKDSKGKVYHY